MTNEIEKIYELALKETRKQQVYVMSEKEWKQLQKEWELKNESEITNDK